MEKELADMTSEEAAALGEFNALVSAKEKTIQASIVSLRENYIDNYTTLKSISQMCESSNRIRVANSA